MRHRENTSRNQCMAVGVVHPRASPTLSIRECGSHRSRTLLESFLPRLGMDITRANQAVIASDRIGRCEAIRAQLESKDPTLALGRVVAAQQRPGKSNMT